MPQTTIGSVAKDIKTAWEATSALTAIIPATKLFYQIADVDSFPFGVFQVTGLGNEYFSGAAFLTRFRVQFDIFDLANGIDPQTIQEAIHTAFSWTPTDPNGAISASVGTLLSVIPADPSLNFVDERLDGQDIVQHTVAFELLYQTTR